MIISRTPLRISFVGGGTDLKAFYEVEPGAIVGTTINKYMYIAVNQPLEETIKVSYGMAAITLGLVFTECRDDCNITFSQSQVSVSWVLILLVPSR